MPEPQDPDEDQGDGSVGNSTIQAMRKQIKDLETKAKATDAEKARADAAEMQLAGFQKQATFDRLQIPPTGPGKLFRKSYDGELTDEAILAEAAEYGIGQAQSATNAPTILGVDQEAWARQQQALSGTQPTQAPSAMQAIQSAKTEKELDAVLSELGLLAE